MNKKIQFLFFGLVGFTLLGCQTASQFNGQSGYQVIEQSKDRAILTYALSGNTRNDDGKLQSACKQVLGSDRSYNVSVLNTGEIINTSNQPEFGRQIGNSNTKFGLSNTPDLYNSNVNGTNPALEAKPATLRVIRFSCS
jgi:hypothetical protein